MDADADHVARVHVQRIEQLQRLIADDCVSERFGVADAST